MHKHLNIALLSVALLFACCKKEPEAGGTFTIIGAHDIDFRTPGDRSLNLTIKKETGKQETVTVSSSAPSTGITYGISQRAGTPDFASTVTFNYSGKLTEGIYPVRITAASASFSTYCDVNLIVPPMNGFKWDIYWYHTYFTARRFNVGSTRTITFNSKENMKDLDLIIHSYDAWPTADGTYTGQVGGSTGYDVELSASGGGQFSLLGFTKDIPGTITIVVKDGKLSISGKVQMSVSGKELEFSVYE